MRWLIVWLAAMVVFTVAFDVNADEIANGGFETGNLSGWIWNPAANVSDAVVMFDVFGGDGPSFAFRVDPTFAATGTAGTLSQWLPLDGGTSYTVSWEQGMQNLGPSLVDNTGIVEVRLGGQLLSRWSQGVLGADNYTALSESKEFTPTIADTYELNYRFVREAGTYGDSTVFMYVDNVSVASPLTVPEPSTLVALMSMGLIGFLGAALRRRRKT